MRICRLEVMNYGRLPDVSIDVRRHLCLVGPNESGKSSLLRILNIALSPSNSAYQQISIEDIRSVDHPIVVKVQFDNLTEIDKGHFCDEITLTASDPSECMLSYRFEFEFVEGDPLEPKAIRKFENYNRDFPASFRKLSLLGFRLFGRPGGGMLDADLNGKNSAARKLIDGLDGSLGNVSDELHQAIDHFNDSLTGSESVIDLVARANSGLLNILPEKIEASPLILTNNSAKAGSLLGNVHWMFASELARHTLLEQSSGIRQITSITLESLNNSNSGIICIDEPESHLHPLRQRALGNILAQGSPQLLVSSHSPQIVSAFNPAEIVIINPSAGLSQIEDPQFEFSGATFTQWWHPNMLEALTATKCVLVEGPSDRMLTRAVLSSLDYDPDARNVAILELGGAGNVSAAMELLGPSGFGLKLFGIVDQAQARDWKTVFGEEFESRVVIMNPELEDVYCSVLASEGLAERLIFERLANEKNLLRRTSSSSLKSIAPLKLANYIKGNKVINGQANMKINSAFVAAKMIDQTNAPQFLPLVNLVSKLRDS